MNARTTIEKMAENMWDLFGANVHYRQPNFYDDLERRSMSNNHPYNNASPELDLAVAFESLTARAENEVDEKYDIILKNILRSRTSSYKQRSIEIFGAEYINDSNEKIEDLLMFLNSNDEIKDTKQMEHDAEQYAIEKKAGNMRDLFGANVHYRQPNVYDDLGRRSMSKNHPYKNGFQKRQNRKDANEDHSVSVKASPELDLAMAFKSLTARAENEVDEKDDIMLKNILRSGDDWVSVGMENVDPEKIMKTRKDDLGPKLGTVKTQIMPGTDLYRLISVLKQISPRLVYVMNTAQQT